MLCPPPGGSREAKRVLVAGGAVRCGPVRNRSALQRRVEAASAVDGFGAGRLGPLPAELVPAQGAAEAQERRLVLLIECSCRQTWERIAQQNFQNLAGSDRKRDPDRPAVLPTWSFPIAASVRNSISR